MIVTIYLFLILFLFILFCNGFFNQLKVKNKFITGEDKKIFELELFGENDSNLCNKPMLEILNELDENKLTELKGYYEKKEDDFESQHRDFINKANMYFQMYLLSWGYIGGLIIFLITGNKENAFPLINNIHVLVFFALLIAFHLIFFLQVLSALIFIPHYETDAKNSIIKNISKEKIEYLKRTVQNKAYAYNCNDLLLTNIKKTLIFTPVKFISVLILITVLAIIVVSNKGGV